MASFDWYRVRAARFAPIVALVAALLTCGGPALAAAGADVVNVPGLTSTTQLIGMTPGSGYTRRQTFTAQQTGDLVGLWIAAACDNCGTGLNEFVNVLVRAPSGGILEIPPLSTWAGGNSGNLQYVDLSNAGSLRVKAGDAVEIDFACTPSSATCLSSFALLATGDQYTGGTLSDISAGGAGTAGASLNADLVFISQMDNVVASPPLQPVQAPQSTTVSINDTDPAIKYTGSGWGYYAGRPGSVGDFQQDVHATLANDAYAAGVHNQGGQVLFSRTGLTAGQHTLKLVKRSGTYMLVDALTVLP